MRSVAEQAKPLLGHVAGYASHKTIAVGLRAGLVAALARTPEGATPEEVATSLSPAHPTHVRTRDDA